MGKKRKRSTHGAREFTETTYGEDEYSTEQPPIEGAHRYNFRDDLPGNLQKYWKQRFDIFSAFNQGVWMTEDSWFEVTPEAIANKIASHVALAIPQDRSIIVDAFCGIGGNTIAFALSGKFKRVYAIEKNEAAIACAKHNAEIYGVSGKITWFQGDCFEILGVDEEKQQKAVGALQEVIGQFGVIFASPPWGGPGYKTAEIFDLARMQPYSVDHMYRKFSKITKTMVLYLPRTSDLQQIADCAEQGQQVQVAHYCTEGTSRALCAYFGDWKHLH